MPFIGQNGRQQEKWATACGVTWDGITNAFGICIDSYVSRFICK